MKQPTLQAKLPDWEDLVDIDAVARWMHTQGLGKGAIEKARSLGGGTQNILLKFEFAGRNFVLRRPPRHPRVDSDDTMRREMRVLAALAGSAVPHPALIRGCPEKNVIGTAFYLMEPIDGFNPTAGLPPLHAQDPMIRRRMGLALVEGIAALGAIDYHAAGLADFGRPENYLHRQVARWRAQLNGYHQFAGWPGPQRMPGVEQVADWLEANRPARFTPGIMHGDYHMANVMYRFDGPELAAIVDWELATIGDPLIDLAWLLATWPEGAAPLPGAIAAIDPWVGFPSAEELIEHYRERTDRDLTDIRWYAILACYKLGIIVEGTYARACAGMAPHETGEQLHAGMIMLFERALRWIRDAATKKAAS